MQTDTFYIIPTALMLIATVISLAYSLRFISKVFLGQSNEEKSVEAEPKEAGHKVLEVSNYIKISFVILIVLVILIGIYPTFFLNLIQTVSFG
jgi:NADH:ubiquinone oxidoreductase subunit 4 (subunit M)